MKYAVMKNVSLAVLLACLSLSISGCAKDDNGRLAPVDLTSDESGHEPAEDESETDEKVEVEIPEYAGNFEQVYEYCAFSGKQVYPPSGMSIRLEIKEDGTGSEFVVSNGRMNKGKNPYVVRVPLRVKKTGKSEIEFRYELKKTQFSPAGSPNYFSKYPKKKTSEYYFVGKTLTLVSRNHPKCSWHTMQTGYMKVD